LLVYYILETCDAQKLKYKISLPSLTYPVNENVARASAIQTTPSGGIYIYIYIYIYIHTHTITLISLPFFIYFVININYEAQISLTKLLVFELKNVLFVKQLWQKSTY